MSTLNSAPEDPGALGQRVNALQAQVKALEAALDATRTTRLVIMVGFVALIAIAGSLFYSLGRRVQDKAYQEELLAVARIRLEGNSDEYMKQVQLFMDDATPIVTKAFFEQTKKDTPLYMQAVNQERSQLLDNLQQRLAAQINARYEETLNQYEQVLVKEFPQATDDRIREQMLANVRVAMDRLVQRYYIDEFKRELTEMYDTWDTFPVAAAPDPDDPPLEDQLIGLLMELMVAKASSNAGYTQLSDDAGTAKPAGAAVPTTDQSPAPEASPTAAEKPAPPATKAETPPEGAKSPESAAPPAK